MFGWLFMLTSTGDHQVCSQYVSSNVYKENMYSFKTKTKNTRGKTEPLRFWVDSQQFEFNFSSNFSGFGAMLLILDCESSAVSGLSADKMGNMRRSFVSSKTV